MSEDARPSGSGMTAWLHALRTKPAVWILIGVCVVVVGVLWFAARDRAALFPQARGDVKGISITGTGAAQNGPPSESVPRVQVIQPQRRHMSNKLTLPATVSPWYQTTLYAKVPGYLKWIGFDKGETVKKGQLLAEIDAPEIKDQYEAAEADYQIKHLTAQRLLGVWKENPDVIARQDVDVALAKSKAARHLRDSRRTWLDYTKVYAPFDGILIARFADPGALIQSATGSATQAVPLFTLVNIDKVRVYVNVPQESAQMTKPGVPVTFTVKELPGKEFTGTITRTTESLDPVTRTLLVEVDLPNKDHLLQPGSFVRATLLLQDHPQALVILPSALVEDMSHEASFVYVVEQGKPVRVPVKVASVYVVQKGKARRVEVKVGMDDGVWVEVLDGLKGDEDVIVVGKDTVTDGQPVEASPYDLPEGTAASQAL